MDRLFPVRQTTVSYCNRGWGGGESEWAPVSSGVSQSAALGLLLFSLYIRDISTYISDLIYTLQQTGAGLSPHWSWLKFDTC